jgi:CheY-like chemotaxis protein
VGHPRQHPIVLRANSEERRPEQWHHPPVSPRALIVDDHASFRAVARRLLEGGGFEVVGEAADGAAAIAAARDLRPDFVLLDVGLPDMDGIAVAGLLADEPDPPIVVLTSGRDAADYGRGAFDGVAAVFVPKGDLSGARLRSLVPGAGP